MLIGRRLIQLYKAPARTDNAGGQYVCQVGLLSAVSPPPPRGDNDLLPNGEKGQQGEMRRRPKDARCYSVRTSTTISGIIQTNAGGRVVPGPNLGAQTIYPNKGFRHFFNLSSQR